jgi:hypothetical protein
MSVHFSCSHNYDSGGCTIRFSSASPFHAPSSWQDLQELSGRYDAVLVVGLFDWSNYSYALVASLSERQSWFEYSRVGLAAFCLDDPDCAGTICPDFAPHYFQSNSIYNTEPAAFLLRGNVLRAACFGPRSFEEIKDFILSNMNG